MRASTAEKTVIPAPNEENCMKPPVAADIWSLIGEPFDAQTPRRTAIFLRPDERSLRFAYPSSWASPGWSFDMREKSTYEERPDFTLELCPYTFPSLGNQKAASLTSCFYQRQVYHPSLVQRELVFASLGWNALETFATCAGGGFAWRFDLNSRCIHYQQASTWYVALSAGLSAPEITCRRHGQTFEVISCDKRLWISAPVTDWGVYASRDAYLDDINLGRLAARRQKGRHLILALAMPLLPARSARLQLGIGFDRAATAEACRRAKDLRGPLQKHWNRWFQRLPAIPFASERERQAYYKCWWVVKLNAYEHPRWGRTVLEAFPVYRGFWLWALPSTNWHSCMNTEQPGRFAKRVLDLFLEHQRADGYLTHAIYLDEKTPGSGWSQSNMTQTPHIPWVALRYYYSTRDRASLARWYPGLKRFYEYLSRSRDPEGRHLWSIIHSCDTGLDTTAVLHRVTYDEPGCPREPYCYPAIYAAERCRYELAMAELAELLGQPEADAWRQAAAETRFAMHARLWDTRRHWFGVRHADGALDTRVGVDGLFPLAYGLADKACAPAARRQFLRLIDNYGVHTVAPGEPGFEPDIYWRGPVWTKSCSCALEAAVRYYPDLVSKIREGLVAMLLKHPSVWECMNAHTGQIARGDVGIMATPVISSNVGAGEALMALFTAQGHSAFAIEEALPLEEVFNYHWAGLRFDLTRAGKRWRIAVRTAEKRSGVLRFQSRRRTIALHVKAGHSYAFA